MENSVWWAWVIGIAVVLIIAGIVAIHFILLEIHDDSDNKNTTEEARRMRDQVTKTRK